MKTSMITCLCHALVAVSLAQPVYESYVENFNELTPKETCDETNEWQRAPTFTLSGSGKTLAECEAGCEAQEIDECAYFTLDGSGNCKMYQFCEDRIDADTPVVKTRHANNYGGTTYLGEKCSDAHTPTQKSQIWSLGGGNHSYVCEN